MDNQSKALRVEIDEPVNQQIVKPAGIIRGWFASRDPLLEKFHFRVGGTTLSHVVTTRVDVEAALPDHFIVGFRLRYDLAFSLPYIQDNRLTLRLTVPGYDMCFVRFRSRKVYWRHALRPPVTYKF